MAEPLADHELYVHLLVKSVMGETAEHLRRSHDHELYVHLLVKSVMGETAEHLRRSHATEPAGDKREDAGRHMEAHELPRNARWSPVDYKFVPPAGSEEQRGTA